MGQRLSRSDSSSSSENVEQVEQVEAVKHLLSQECNKGLWNAARLIQDDTVTLGLLRQRLSQLELDKTTPETKAMRVLISKSIATVAKRLALHEQMLSLYQACAKQLSVM